MRMIVSGSQCRAVYADALRPLAEAMGEMTVQRASSVEFDEASGEWQAMLASGDQIAHGRERNEVLRAEVAWLERRLAALSRS